MSLSVTVTQLRISLWNSEKGVCIVILERGLPSLEYKLAVARAGMNLPDGSCLIRDESCQLPDGDELFGR